MEINQRSYNNNRIKSAVQPIIDEQTVEMMHKDQDIAEIMMKHFGDKEVEIEAARKESISMLAEWILQTSRNEDSPIINVPFTLNETKKAIAEIKSNIGYNPHEDIHPLMMKNNHSMLAEVIKDLANICLRKGSFPADTKLDHKNLIGKDAVRKNEKTGYRP